MIPSLDELLYPGLPDENSGPDHEVPDGPCDHCPGCLTFCRFEPLPDDEAFFRLIYKMAMEILSLEEEVVRWRQVLIKYLDKRWADGLSQDIFSNLAPRFSGIPIYDRFVDEYCSGKDPMESAKHTRRMLRLRDGTDRTSIHYL